ncbi:MAG: TRAP transporter permease [Atribacterota bacterium]
MSESKDVKDQKNVEQSSNKEKENSEKIDVQALLEKYDSESRIRKPVGIFALIITILAVSMSAFHFYTAGFGLILALKQRAVHLAFTLALVFLLYPFGGKKSDYEKGIHQIPFYDVILSILGALVCMYLVVFYDQLVLRAGLPTMLDLIVGGATILLVLEATRRSIGLPLVIVVIVFLAYAFLGPYIPGYLAHRGYSLVRLIDHLATGTEGIYGIPLSVSATFVFLFILFGAILSKSGMGKFFIDLSLSVAGSATGGPAKVAVLASGFMGSINGSSVANTVTTGSFTIPLMKSIGYRRNFAGAVEAAASTGGQILPPIMGAAAFIMAEFLGIPYIRIAVVAIIPALLYFLSVLMMVHLEAKREGLEGLPKDKIPDLRAILLERGHLLIPIGVLVYLLVRAYTPLFAAFWAIVSTVAISMLKKVTRMNLKDLIGGFEEGAKGALGVACACASAGIIIGVVTLTGIGLKIANSLVMLGGGNLFYTLFFTMIASILLGMGMPTTAKYIILSIMAAPALVNMGVHPIAAHLFILYFGVIADLTPPVAVAAFAAAGISGGDSMKTGFIAVRLAIAGFMIPYVFCFDSGLMGIDSTILHTALLIFTSFAGIVALGSAAGGYLITRTKIHERIILILSAFVLLRTSYLTDVIGLALLSIVIIMQVQRKKKAEVSAT